MTTNQVIQGDALEVLKTFPAQCADLILTDPPYSLPNNQFRPEARINQRTWSEFSPYQAFFDLFITQTRRILKPDGDLIIFCDETFYPVLYPALYRNFYATKLLVWDKGRIGMGGIWRRQFELATHSYFQPQKEKSGDADILRFPPVNGKDKLHNSQKPIDILKRLIEKTTKEGDLVIDPFSGSGSTAVAAKETGRNYIAIELEPDCAEIIKTRLQ